MKKILTFILLFTITLFLSGNQVVITQNYNFIVSNQSTFNFSTGALTSDDRYQRTNKIAITNDKVLADPLKYHYAFFWDEADTYLGYYKTNRGITTSGTYLGQVNTQNIPLPLNAYSFALVRYDNDYVLVNGYTIKDLFIDNNLDYDDLPDFNDIPIPELNGLTLNEVFDNRQLTGTFDSGTTTGNIHSTTITLNPLTLRFATSLPAVNNVFIYAYARLRYTNASSTFINFTLNGTTSGTTLQIGIQDPAVSNQFYVLSGIVNPTNHVGNIQHRFNVVGGDATKTIEVDMNFGVNYINLTALGIGNLTKAQLDRYFELYTNPINWIYYKTDSNVSSVDNHYYAAGKNLFDKDSAIIAAGGYGISGNPDTNFTDTRIENYINVKSNTQYFIRTNDTPIVRRLVEYDENFNINAIVNSPSVFTTKSNTRYIRFHINTASFNFNATQLEIGATGTTFEAYAAPTNLLNLTLLFGINNEPNLATMNGYYAAYEEYLDYTFILPLTFANQTLSYEEFYFDDGVSTEIERLGSILIFTLIGFTLMIFGFVTNRRIFNLLSIGAFVVLGVLLVEFVGFLIILFGLIFLNVYYTFFGEL